MPPASRIRRPHSHLHVSRGCEAWDWPGKVKGFLVGWAFTASDPCVWVRFRNLVSPITTTKARGAKVADASGFTKSERSGTVRRLLPNWGFAQAQTLFLFCWGSRCGVPLEWQKVSGFGRRSLGQGKRKRGKRKSLPAATSPLVPERCS